MVKILVPAKLFLFMGFRKSLMMKSVILNGDYNK